MKNADRAAYAPGFGESEQDAMGLTKREHFAAMAMQGLLANSSLTLTTHHQYAVEALRVADELLQCLEEKGND